jgi:FkbM family methyltransferase
VEQIYHSYLEVFSVKLDPDLMMEKHVIDHGVWESPSVWLIEKTVKPGDICIDIGANSGLLSLAIAKATGSLGKVYCFEPCAEVFPRLVDNININPQLREVIVAEKMGIGDKDGYFVIEGENGGNAQITSEITDATAPVKKGEICIVTTLDKLFVSNRVDFLKIDVEGMELEVFKGGINLIRQNKPKIWYESEIQHGWFDPEKVKACEALLRAEGYELFKVHPKGGLIPVSFPDYDVNSLAVHREQLSAISDLLMSSEEKVSYS